VKSTATGGKCSDHGVRLPRLPHAQSHRPGPLLPGTTASRTSSRSSHRQRDKRNTYTRALTLAGRVRDQRSTTFRETRAARYTSPTAAGSAAGRPGEFQDRPDAPQPQVSGPTWPR
jgi:hypothetical protein